MGSIVLWRAQADGEVKTFFDDVDVAVGHAELDLHFRVRRHEARQHREQPVVRTGGGCADAQGARRQRLLTGHHAAGFGNWLQRLAWWRPKKSVGRMLAAAAGVTEGEHRVTPCCGQ